MLRNSIAQITSNDVIVVVVVAVPVSALAVIIASNGSFGGGSFLAATVALVAVITLRIATQRASTVIGSHDLSRMFWGCLATAVWIMLVGLACIGIHFIYVGAGMNDLVLIPVAIGAVLVAVVALIGALAAGSMLGHRRFRALRW